MTDNVAQFRLGHQKWLYLVPDHRQPLKVVRQPDERLLAEFGPQKTETKAAYVSVYRKFSPLIYPRPGVELTGYPAPAQPFLANCSSLRSQRARSPVVRSQPGLPRRPRGPVTGCSGARWR